MSEVVVAPAASAGALDLDELEVGSSAPEGELAGRPRPHRARRVLVHLGVIGAFALPAVVLWWHAWIGGLGSTLTCACGDSGQQVWFVAWPAYALAHGHNPFFSSAVAVPGGVNLLDNTSSPLIGLVLAPVTWLWGPVVSTNLALTLAPALSAWAAWVACRRCTRWGPAAVVAGLLYGYSPFIVDNEATGHLMLTLLVVPPLVLVVLDELLVRQRGDARRWGSALGLLVFVQFFISTEELALIALLVVAGILVAAICAPRVVRPRLRYAAQGLAVGTVVAVVLCALPAWFALEGPRRIVGPPFPGIQIDGNRFFDLWNPGAFAQPAGGLLRISGYEGSAGPTSAYLGVGVLGLVGVSLVLAWRRPVVRVMAVLFLVATVLSLGPLLWTSPGHLAAGQWLPWRLFANLPLFDRVAPQRLSALGDLFVAVLVAVALDELHVRLGARARRWRSVGAPRRRRDLRPATLGLLVTAVGLAALVPMWVTYDVPFAAHRVSDPAVFARPSATIVPGAVVLAYPFPIDGQSEAMVWQAEEAMGFRLAGAYAKVPGPSGRALIAGAPGSTVRLLADLSQGAEGDRPTGTPGQVAQLRTALVGWGVDDVVVSDGGRDPVFAAALFTAALGRLPTWTEGAWVFPLAAHPSSSSPVAASEALAACVALLPPSGPAGATTDGAPVIPAADGPGQAVNQCVLGRLAPA
jgi:hypothetical protein